MKNVLYYKYIKLDHLETFQKEHLELCKSLNLLGKVLVAKEGINGCLSGSEESVKKYTEELTKDPRFKDMQFKITEANKKHTFKKLFVRIRKEIVTYDLGPAVDMKDKADYIEPEELKELLDSDEELFLFDVRNLYESKIGKFEGAIPLEMDTSRELPEAVKKLEKYKDKPVVTYCTGGIRCEKATAYLREHGFKNVRQLHGGIIRYGEHCGNAHWEGKCFVFDERGAIDIDPKNQSEPITICEYCRLPCAEYHNCKHTLCDKRFIACTSCLQQFDGCCSKKCKAIIEQKPGLKAKAK